MGWSVGFDDNWKRWIGYGVPAYCDHPDCTEEIDRGLSYVCGGEPYGGDTGCALFFCQKHLILGEVNYQCERCIEGKTPFPPKQDHPKWVAHVLNDPSWAAWREENPRGVAHYKALYLS